VEWRGVSESEKEDGRTDGREEEEEVRIQN
jgi:hypothetical protein